MTLRRARRRRHRCRRYLGGGAGMDVGKGSRGVLLVPENMAEYLHGINGLVLLILRVCIWRRHGNWVPASYALGRHGEWRVICSNCSKLH